MRITGELTKSGVFEYTRADGQVVREYRPSEEVAKAESLATIEDIPATIGHPSVGMSAETFGKLAVGHARSPVVEGGVVRGTITVGRKDAIEALGSGKLVETSMGYQCEVDPTPGVTPDGQRYDCVQRSIEYNHVALLPAGGARLGTRLDGAQAPVLRLDSAGNQIADTENHIMKVKIKRADGAEYEVDRGSEEHIAYLEAQNAAVGARADAAETELKGHREDAAKRNRAEIETAARGVLGKEEKFDGKTDRQIREAVISKRLPAVKCDGLDDVHVGAYFDAALSVAAPAPKAPKQPNAVIKALASARKDAAKEGGESGEDDEDADDKKNPFAKKAAEMKSKADSAWERG